VAARDPAAEGLNVTLAVQLAEAARLVPHVLLEIVKSAELVPETATLLIVIEDASPLFRVADCAALATPTVVLAKAMLAGDAATVPVELPPVPVRETDCGLPLSESVNFRVAARVPAAEGLNVILAVQLAEAARLVPHVLLEIVKSAASVPEIAMLLIVIEDASPFFSVADCAALLEPIAVLAKESPDGLAVTLPVAAAPVPERATVCGLPLPVSVKFRVAVRLPLALGPNNTFTVQFAEAARLVPQVLVKIVKSAALVPEVAMLLIVIAAVPLFVRVTTFCAPSPPTGTLTQFRLVGETVTAARQFAPWSAQNTRTA
jgi:hypothetical protein